MNKKWKKLMAVICATALLLMLPALSVLADELHEDEIFVSMAEDPIQETNDTEQSDHASALAGVEPSEITTVEGDLSEVADEAEDILLEKDDSADALVGALESTGNATLDNFINDYRFTAGVYWPDGQTPKIASYQGWGCCAYCADYVKYCFGINNPRGGTYFTNINEVCQGDVLIVGNPSDGTGHWFVCLKRSGNRLYVAEGNFSSHVRIGWNYTISGSKFAEDGRYFNCGYHFMSGSSGMSSGYDRVLPDGDYLIVSAANPNYYLDIEGSALPAADGSNVHIWSPSTDPSSWDVWNLTYSNGFYTIRQKGTNMALDVVNAESSPGTNIWVFQSNGSDAQKWAISSFGDKKGYRIQAKCSGNSLDITGGTIANATNVQQYTGNDSNAQRWLFIPFKPSKTVSDGRYVLVSALNSKVVLNISNPTLPSPNVQIWNDSASTKDNTFDVKYLDNGYYRLTHVTTGKSIEVYNSSVDSTANIRLYATADNNNQKWAIMKLGDGYMLVSKNSGLVMDITGASTTDGTNVQQYYYSGSKAQQWKFVRAEYTVSYNANGGTGAPASQTKYYRNTLTLSSTKPTRSGYTFKGWATTQTASSAEYQAGGTYVQDKNITLYAVWEVRENQISNCTVTLSPTSYTYNGKARKPSVTVKDGTYTLVAGTDYTIGYSNNTNAGTATVTITGKGNYTETNSATFTIKKAAAKLTFENASVSKTTKDAAFTNQLTKTTDGNVTFKSSNTNAATVNSSGLVTITGAGTTTITATAAAGKNYRAGSASYTLTVKEASTVTGGFSDVQDPAHPFYDAIYWAADAGITKGYSDGTFGINRSCTRGEMMMFLWRYAGKQEPKTVSKSPFKDVPKTHTFYKAILWGSQKGITKGYSDGTFGVDRNVSRGECMMFLWRLKGKPAPQAVAKAPFPDVPKSHAFYNAVLWGYQKKITTGFTSGELKGKFGVDENCSRGQIVTFLYRAK